MAAVSKNKYDVYVWIKKIIDSINKYEQTAICNQLIFLFIDMYNDSYLSRLLTEKLLDKKISLSVNK